MGLALHRSVAVHPHWAPKSTAASRICRRSLLVASRSRVTPSTTSWDPQLGLNLECRPWSCSQAAEDGWGPIGPPTPKATSGR